ncbi:MAG: ribonuclease P protein component [Gemmatimonadota bacterium]|nr:ribonuclease P protein component [Gemmatimonadota bacterium]
MGYPRKLAIGRSGEISRVIKRGIFFSDRLLRVNVLTQHEERQPPPTRVALIVPRFGRTAVLRNRLKRRLQGIVQVSDALSRGYLLVVRVLPEAYEADFHTLEAHFNDLAAKVAARGSG